MQLVKLRLRQAFNISKASTSKQESLIVRWRDGIGEGAPSIHYGLDAVQLQDSLERLLAQLGEPQSSAELEHIIDLLPPDLNVARCALEMAYLEQQARKCAQPLWQYLGLEKPGEVESSITITLGDPREIDKQLERAVGFSAAKLKVGFARDLWFVDEILKRCEMRLRLDANGGWNLTQAVERLRALAGYPIDFVEEPLSDPSLMELDKIKSRVDCVLLLDESIKSVQDIEHYSEVADGVNLKLAKCGGISRTISMARVARASGLQLLLGCMLESAVGITAALHLASLFDYFDLDSIMLTENDPFWGAQFEDGRLILPETVGIGVSSGEQNYV
jgi:L-alanine-DL-glutamate epimerase-like enolase superfamily enzyme